MDTNTNKSKHNSELKEKNALWKVSSSSSTFEYIHLSTGHILD